MPSLPTLTVSQAHLDRIVQVFPGTTTEEKVASYRAWLTNSLIDRVEGHERARIEREAAEYLENALEELSASLPPRAPYPQGDTLADPAPSPA